MHPQFSICTNLLGSLNLRLEFSPLVSLAQGEDEKEGKKSSKERKGKEISSWARVAQDHLAHLTICVRKKEDTAPLALPVHVQVYVCPLSK